MQPSSHIGIKNLQKVIAKNRDTEDRSAVLIVVHEKRLTVITFFVLPDSSDAHLWGAVCKATQYKILHHFLVKLRAISYIVAIYVYCCNMC